MKKRSLAVLSVCVSIFAFFTVSVSAYRNGNLEYITESNGTVTITGCDDVPTIEIPRRINNIDVTAIGDNAFSEKSSLTGVTIPDCVTKIGNNAFYSCENLRSISIPESVASIGTGAFEYCAGLTSVTIPSSVKKLSERMFSSCASLESITIPSGVTEIDNYAFEQCYSLKDVYYYGTADDWKKITVGEGNEYLKNAHRNYLKTRTTISGNTFTVTPQNIDSGKTVILALYNGEQLVDVQSAVYSGEDMPFETNKKYTKAKVMVWENFDTMIPVCDAEIVNK